MFSNFKNEQDKVVYIDKNKNIWCKSKPRFYSGMKIVENIGEEISIEKVFYASEPVEKSTVYVDGKFLALVCIANEAASDKTDYPVMVIVKNDQDEYFLYRRDELTNNE